MPVEGVLNLYKGIKSVKEGKSPIPSWEMFGIYDEKELRDLPDWSLPIGTFDTMRKAEEAAQYYIGWTSDNKLKTASLEEFQDLSEKIAGSEFDVATVFRNVMRKELGKRFRRIYEQYGNLDTPKDIMELRKNLAKNKVNVPEEDMDKIDEIEQMMLDFDANEAISEGIDYVIEFIEKTREVESENN